MKYNWNTMLNTQAERQEVSWKIRFIGNSEVKYFLQLIQILGTLGVRYRITNSTTHQTWIVKPNSSPIYGIHRCEYIYDMLTGEVLAVNGDVLRVFVYKY